MPVNNVVAFNSIPLNAGTRSESPQEQMLSGDPASTTWPVFDSADGKVNIGFWECNPYEKIKQSPNKAEYVYLLEGDVKLTDKEGISQTFKTGEAFVIEPGFDGVWESVGKVRKHYVIYTC